MPVTIRAMTRLQDGDDVNMTLGAVDCSDI
jgi:hypothetical protein